MNAVLCPFTSERALLWSKFGNFVPKLYCVAGFSCVHLEIVSCIRNIFSGEFSSVMGAVRVLPPRFALEWVAV